MQDKAVTAAYAASIGAWFMSWLPDINLVMQFFALAAAIAGGVATYHYRRKQAREMDSGRDSGA